MTREEYREHLKEVIMAVFTAENKINEDNPTLVDDLSLHRITPDEYVGMVADELLKNLEDTPWEDDKNNKAMEERQ